MGVRVVALMGFYPEVNWRLAERFAEDGWVARPFMEPLHRALYQINPIILDEKIMGGFDDYQSLHARLAAQDGHRSFIWRARALQASYPEVDRLAGHALPSWASQELNLGNRKDNLWIDQWRVMAKQDLEQNGVRLVIPDLTTEAQLGALRSIVMAPFSKVVRVLSAGSGRTENELAHRAAGDLAIRCDDESFENLKDELLAKLATPRFDRSAKDRTEASEEDPQPTPETPDCETASEPHPRSDSSSAETLP